MSNFSNTHPLILFDKCKVVLYTILSQSFVICDSLLCEKNPHFDENISGDIQSFSGLAVTPVRWKIEDRAIPDPSSHENKGWHHTSHWLQQGQDPHCLHVCHLIVLFGGRYYGFRKATGWLTTCLSYPKPKLTSSIRDLENYILAIQVLFNKNLQRTIKLVSIFFTKEVLNLENTKYIQILNKFWTQTESWIS